MLDHGTCERHEHRGDDRRCALQHALCRGGGLDRGEVLHDVDGVGTRDDGPGEDHRLAGDDRDEPLLRVELPLLAPLRDEQRVDDARDAEDTQGHWHGPRHDRRELREFVVDEQAHAGQQGPRQDGYHRLAGCRQAEFFQKPVFA